MKRYSVLYLLGKRYHHIACTSQSEAEAILKKLATDEKRKPVGIYDAKTELFDWEPVRQHNYDQAAIEEQGKLGNQIITIAQALRRRDSTWQKIGEVQRPSFFA